MRPPILIDEATFNERLQRLVAAGGDADVAGVSLEEVGDMVHTRLTIVSPGIGEATTTRATKAAAKKQEKISGPDMEGLLG